MWVMVRSILLFSRVIRVLDFVLLLLRSYWFSKRRRIWLSYTVYYKVSSWFIFNIACVLLMVILSCLSYSGILNIINEVILFSSRSLRSLKTNFLFIKFYILLTMWLILDIHDSLFLLFILYSQYLINSFGILLITAL